MLVLSFSCRFFFCTWERLITLIGLTRDAGICLGTLAVVVVVDVSVGIGGMELVCFIIVVGGGLLVKRGAVILVILTSGVVEIDETVGCDCTTGKLG